MQSTILTMAFVAFVAILAAVAAPRPAASSEYLGWGDTGWIYASKRECCKAAIAIAQQNSMDACIDAGGLPRPLRGSTRGSCEARWTQAPGGGLLYRCVSESAVWCR